MTTLSDVPAVMVRQRKELFELIGFETRNKYEVRDLEGNLIFYCAEMQKGFFGFLLRQFLGHWRSFELHFFDIQTQLAWRAIHPFRFIFQRLDIVMKTGEVLGEIEWRWGILRKRYALQEYKTRKLFEIDSGFFSFWTFNITQNGRSAGQIQKKWSGALKEIFTDADHFLVTFSPEMTERERTLVLTTAILIDLNHFEKKAGR